MQHVKEDHWAKNAQPDEKEEANKGESALPLAPLPIRLVVLVRHANLDRQVLFEFRVYSYSLRPLTCDHRTRDLALESYTERNHWRDH